MGLESKHKVLQFPICLMHTASRWFPIISIACTFLLTPHVRSDREVSTHGFMSALIKVLESF